MHQVDEDLLNLRLISKEDQFSRLQLLVKLNALAFQLVLQQKFQLIKQGGQSNTSEFGCWNMCQAAEIGHKADQALAPFLNGLNPHQKIIHIGRL